MRVDSEAKRKEWIDFLNEHIASLPHVKELIVTNIKKATVLLIFY